MSKKISHVGHPDAHDNTSDSPHDASAVVEDQTIDHQAEARLVRKLDLHIVPFVMLLYLLSFLDRVNIGNARLYGLEEDLGLKGDQYQIAVSILFVTYLLSEVPSNLALKKFRPSRWIAFITVAWSIIATLTGVVQSYGGLIAVRLLLGLFEGGLFPGMTVYLTMFYSKKEIALRIGYLFVSAAIAGACGGLLAFGVGHMDGIAGLRGWRWIMIIEGLPTFILGIAVFFGLADSPETARYLTAAEKQLMVLRRKREIGQTASAQEFHWADSRRAFLDWKIYAFCAAQFGMDTMLYGFSTFLPTIIKGINPAYSTAVVQVLTIPCYALGAVTYLVVARLSDASQRRGVFACGLGIVSIVGYAILMSNVSSRVHYFGTFLVAGGLYVAVGLPLAHLPSNYPRYGARTTATGLQLTFGNAAGIMSPFLYKTNEGPRYIRGHGVTMGMIAMAVIVLATMSLYYARANRRRARGLEDEKIRGLSDDEVDELGHRSPRFVYTV